MKFYQEMTLLPDSEISPYFLWTKVYTQLHIAIADVKNTHGVHAIGVSFPNYRYSNDNGKISGTLGRKLRVFAQSEDELVKLDLSKQLERLTDYVHITSIKPVPIDKITGYAQYYRVIPKMSLEQRIAHQAKRHGVSLEEATAHLKNYQTPPTSEPFIRLTSHSTGHEFSLYIGKTITDSTGDGHFGTYGLSRSAGVPEF
ncbi:type I-F CRISPR-associated endoribonuclease Cas6/Csy4 [Moraxella sp. FZLJ2107]|uniref:type I-F CRISPR-associated endoribonuclease Cas6/Csy4 n=1 Tax=unclassified Moraxella TaxID=2685852 RepID=UPI0020C83432|nr:MULTISPECIES: type I-F CRISPR-associated endoribonuclease Cas6/Csy4 [unclassified Moraxella]UTO04313.1 type I-F CRISPR-associated endoribonuclease Cas6/Csy4 [Moraxella sp. FZLJ2107]UTO23146.1 type I-F CRISPR-associated endoribonuclease Cas6/Csy4 [Moraxella sp. FZLJ2109]